MMLIMVHSAVRLVVADILLIFTTTFIALSGGTVALTMAATCPLAVLSMLVRVVGGRGASPTPA